MLEKVDNILAKLHKILIYILIVFMAVMLVVCWAHIFWRYVLNNSLSWSEEFLRVMLVWFSMLSASVLATRREHVSIVVFKKMFPNAVETGLDRFAQILALVASVLVTWEGVRLVISAGVRMTPAMHLPYAWAYAALPVSFFIISLYELRNVVADFCHGKHAVIEKVVD